MDVQRPDLTLCADGRQIRPSLVRGSNLAFAVVVPISDLRLTDAGRVQGRAGWSLSALRIIQPDASIPLDLLEPAGANTVFRLARPELLASRRGPAVLHVTLAAPGGEAIEAVGPKPRIIFLSGDSRPKDNYFAELLRPKLLPFFTDNFRTEGELLGVLPEQPLGGTVAPRKARLTRLLEADGDRHDLILMGRSAGGRIASSVADAHGVRGVVCLGYPFRHPGMGEEPDRYLHLARMRTPTLIIQGIRDDYGGAASAWRYARSPRVDMALIDAKHDFVMPDTKWSQVGRRILLFLTHRCAP